MESVPKLCRIGTNIGCAGGYSCSPTSTCEVCCSWSEDTWKKCLVVATAQAPEKGPGQPSASLGYFSSSSVHLFSQTPGRMLSRMNC